MMTERVRSALNFIDAHHVFSLALAGEDGPHACSLFYRSRGFTLYWVSDPATRHSQIIDRDGGAAASVTIAPDYRDFTEIRGLQMTGRARRIDDMAEAALLMPLFAARYPFFARFSEHAAVAKAMAKARIYQLTPERARFVDNTVRFGHKDEFSAAELAVAG